MPAKKKIFREDILNAALELVRRQGPEGFSVRNTARQLGASTQPIYSEFENLEALRNALLEEIRERFLRSQFQSYKAFALAFLRFARNEPGLFRFLYLRRRRPDETLLDDVNYTLTVDLLVRNLEMSPEQAGEMHRRMQCHCYALGVMIATDYRDLSEEEMSRELTDFFSIMLRYYKQIQNEDEFRFWLHRARNLIL